ncbi:MAG: hypothetical protein R3E12_10780 [Candidatus Eisenbacteria bacterium]|uniref:Uncharacterized protein n=1 Tax=Eiseniibacteriota bacterium TaxID=2212470 RepID=A0A956RPF7_UNCEI|nr:hypothetical protein [Candidatus Eisenbacteria bacterium]
MSGGNFSNGGSIVDLDVTDAIRAGKNTLYVYQRDLGCGWAGVIFSATVDIDSPTPLTSTSWGNIKSMYR